MRSFLLALVAICFLSGCAATQVVRQPETTFAPEQVPQGLRSASGTYITLEQELGVVWASLSHDGGNFATVRGRIFRNGSWQPVTFHLFHGNLEGSVPQGLPVDGVVIACHAELLPPAVRARALVVGKGKTQVWAVTPGIYGVDVIPPTAGELALLRERSQPLFK